MRFNVPTQMKKTYRVLLILISACLCLTGCSFDLFTGTDNNQDNLDSTAGLEYGFVFSSSSSSAPTKNTRCAYKSDKNEFDIDDVTLDFFYGGIYPSGVDLANGASYPSFELYFTDEKDNKMNHKIFVKRVEENFVSEKYRCFQNYDETNHTVSIKYNHSETITIPKEIFTEDTGLIRFQVYGININAIEPKVEAITGVNIFYKKIDQKIILSSKKFD